MSKQLLIETRMNSLALNESKSRQVHPGCLGTLDGPCADLKNATRNGNFYSRKLWENVFRDPIVKESLEDRILIGELDHPGDRLETKAVNACIVMTGYEFDDANGLMMGTFDILDTPNGRILKSLLDYGCKIGVSSRGEGDVTTVEGVNHVDEDSFQFMGFDAVVLPAVKAAKPALRESLNREAKSLRESLTQQVCEATTVAELDLIKRVVGAMDLPDSDSLMESVNKKAQELTEGSTGSSNLLEDLETANAQIRSLTGQLNKLKEELTTSKSRVSKLMKSRQRLVSQLSEQRKQFEELQDASTCHAFETSQNSRMIESLRGELSKSQETIKDFRQRIRTADSDRVKTESRVRSLEESLSEAQKLTQSKIREVNELNAKIEEMKRSSAKALNESANQDSRLRSSLSSAKKSLTESVSFHNEFVKAYVSDACKSSGVEPKLVFESIKPGMTKRDIDRIIESVVDRSDRYRSLTFTQDPLINSVSSKGSVNFSGSNFRVDQELAESFDFITQASKQF